MSAKEILRRAVLTFCPIATASLLCTAIFTSLFSEDGFQPNIIFWQILFLSAVCSLSFFVYYSRSSLGKHQWLARKILQFVFLAIALLGLAIWWGWVNTDDIAQIIVFVAMVGAVYGFVIYFLYKRDQRTADKMNAGLEKYKQQSFE